MRNPPAQWIWSGQSCGFLTLEMVQSPGAGQLALPGCGWGWITLIDLIIAEVRTKAHKTLRIPQVRCTRCWADLCNTISERARSFNNGSQFGFIVYHGHLISPFFPLFISTQQVHDKIPNIYSTCFSWIKNRASYWGIVDRITCYFFFIC